MGMENGYDGRWSGTYRVIDGSMDQLIREPTPWSLNSPN